jgi:Cytochrome b5-like Heme/Steroid binding domain
VSVNETLRLASTDLRPPVQEQSQKRPLVLIAGYIHDVSTFLEEHPGGRHLLVKNIGKDASTAFFGGVYDHSNAAHNVCLIVLFGGAFYLMTSYTAALHDASGNSPRRCTSWDRRQSRPSITTLACCEAQRVDQPVQLCRDVGWRGHAWLMWMICKV